MQHSNRVVVLRVGAIDVVVIYLLNNHAENGIFTGLLCVEMAFVNTSIMFNRTARKVTASARYFPPLGDATFRGSSPSELKLYWLWQRNWKKKESSKTFGDTATYISCTFVQYVSNQECAAVVCLRMSIIWSFSLSSGGSRPSDNRGGGGDHPDPSDKRGAPVSKKIFFGLKIRGARPPGPLPWLRHCSESFFDFWLMTNRKKA